MPPSEVEAELDRIFPHFSDEDHLALRRLDNRARRFPIPAGLMLHAAHQDSELEFMSLMKSHHINPYHELPIVPREQMKQQQSAA